MGSTVPVRTSSQYFISKLTMMKSVLVFTFFLIGLSSSQMMGFMAQFGLADLGSLSQGDCEAALRSVAGEHGDMMVQDMDFIMGKLDGDELYLMQQFKYYFELAFWDVLCYYIRNPEKINESQETSNYIY